MNKAFEIHDRIVNNIELLICSEESEYFNLRTINYEKEIVSVRKMAKEKNLSMIEAFTEACALNILSYDLQKLVISNPELFDNQKLLKMPDLILHINNNLYQFLDLKLLSLNHLGSVSINLESYKNYLDIENLFFEESISCMAIIVVDENRTDYKIFSLESLFSEKISYKVCYYYDTEPMKIKEIEELFPPNKLEKIRSSKNFNKKSREPFLLIDLKKSDLMNLYEYLTKFKLMLKMDDEMLIV